MSWGTVSSRNLGTLLEGKAEEMRQQSLYILNMYIYIVNKYRHCAFFIITNPPITSC